MKKKFDDFEKKIDIKFKNQDLLLQVFVHRSYLNENPEFKHNHNERLEFLGDAVLELVVTEYLFQNYPNPEGELTNLRSALVKGPTLSSIATQLKMDDYLYLSKGESKSEGKARQLILANAFEALIGAIYLDHGYIQSQAFIKKYLLNSLNEIIEKKLYLDPKSHLQELAQSELNITPSYRVIKEFGPDHNKNFLIGCFLGEKKVGEGNGSSKQIAESEAAQASLDDWSKILSNNKFS